jgi:hypothetical protein
MRVSKVTYPFAQCECSFFVRGSIQEQWRKATDYILKTEVSRPLRLARRGTWLEADRWEEGSSWSVKVKIFYRKPLRYSFSFSLEKGEFSQVRQPPWRRQALLVEHRGVILRIVPRKDWFPKQTKTAWIDIERTAQVVGFRGEVTLKEWSLKGDRSLRLRKGILLKPGCYLGISDAAAVKIKLDSGETKSFPERTIVLFRKRPMLIGVKKEAHLRHAQTSKGSIGIHRAGKYLQVPSGKEVSLRVGDMVRTAVEGRAEILLSDGQRIRVDPLCSVFIEDIVKFVTLAKLMEGRVEVIPKVHLF